MPPISRSRDDDMQALTQASQPAVQSIMPGVGPYPYPMLEYGSPALPEFYSRFLLFGQVGRQNRQPPPPCAVSVSTADERDDEAGADRCLPRSRRKFITV